MKYNKYIFAVLLAFGVFTILQYLKTDILYLLTYGITAIFIWLFSISDIKTKTVSALWIYIAMVIVFLLRFSTMCSFAVNRVPVFMIESIIVFIVLNILSKALKNRIGSGDFDIVCIIYLSIGLTGMFCSFVIACLLSLIFSLNIILKKHKNLKSYSVPFIPYLYMGYLIVLLLAKELIFI